LSYIIIPIQQFDFPFHETSKTHKMSAEKFTGKCKWFNAKKGFGFIVRDDEQPDIFVHQSGIHAEGFRSLGEGEEVHFEVTADAEGRLKAVNVTGPAGAYVQGAKKPDKRRRRRRRNNNRGENNDDETNQPENAEPQPVEEEN
jgi:cold shock CspA family protein